MHPNPNLWALLPTIQFFKSFKGAQLRNLIGLFAGIITNPQYPINNILYPCNELAVRIIYI